MKYEKYEKMTIHFTEALCARKPPENLQGCQGKCPMTMHRNRRRVIATVSHGDARILQAPDSDVSLNIPEGSEGLFTMKIHTDHTRFLRVIPDEECIISPLVQVEHKKISDEVKGKESLIYDIKIPHSLRSAIGYKTVRVRRGQNFENKISIQELKMRSEAEGDSYEIDQKFITIFTWKFSTFVCTSCGNTCQARVMLFLLGKLEPRQEASDTLTQIKSYICSDLYCIKDFREVSENSYSKVLNLNIIIFSSIL